VADGYSKDAEALGASQPIRFHFIPDKEGISKNGVFAFDDSVYSASGMLRIRAGGVLGLVRAVRGLPDDVPMAGGHFYVHLRHEPDGKWAVLSATLGEGALYFPADRQCQRSPDRREARSHEK
jgi:hypothetical protein